MITVHLDSVVFDSVTVWDRVARAVLAERAVTAGDRLPEPDGFLRSNSMLVHVRAAEHGAGIGLLPSYLGRASTALVRVVPDCDLRITYWASVRREALRNRGVEAALDIIREFAGRAPAMPEVLPGSGS